MNEYPGPSSGRSRGWTGALILIMIAGVKGIARLFLALSLGLFFSLCGGDKDG